MSNIPNITENIRIVNSNGECGLRLTKNDYFDLHLFINQFLSNLGFFPLIDMNSPIMKFFNKIVPDQYVGIYNSDLDTYRLKTNIEYTTPKKYC
jgi:hypothetical protein